MAVSHLGDIVFHTMADNVSVTANTPIENHASVHPQITATNNSVPDGCFEIRFDQMEYLPWNNPDTIVTAEMEATFRGIKNNILGVLTAIGVPANVINMAVFFKQGLKDRVNLCLFTLSLADALYLTQAICIHGEQLHLQWTTKETYGPFMTFLVNNNIVGLFGFQWVSQILSAIIASERCLCVFNPLRFQTVLRTRTMAVIIIVVNTVVVGLFSVTAVRYRIGCAYDPFSDTAFRIGIDGEFYRTHKEFITYLDSFVYGAGIPGVVIIVVTTSTILTTVKLRQIVTWRAETSSSLSPREIALTKMLIGSSVFFIICVSPIAVLRFALLFLPEMNNGGRNQNFYLFGLWLLEIVSYTNSTFNIVVYYSMGSRYRETVRALFKRQRPLHNSKTIPGMTLVTRS